jgi:peptidoglycan hydrolase FlgJ
MSSTGPVNSAGGPLNATGPGALDQSFALDVQGLEGLRRVARNTPEQALKQAARQFEAVFMQMVLKSMREATPSDGLLDSDQSKLYTSMLDQQLAQSLSGRGLGLAEAMYAQLSRNLPARPPQVPEAPAASDKPLAAPVQTPAAPVPDLSFYDAAADRPTRALGPTAPAHIEQFVARMAAPAQAASRTIGVSPQLILAQAALESGWGRREIRGEDGAPSYNLFGIKADRNWKGRVVETVTTEYVDGVPQRTVAAFRAYGSYDEAFADYARFLAGNPRYAQVLATRDPTEAAYGLQRAGYATDPQYGGKLVRIMKQIT